MWPAVLLRWETRRSASRHLPAVPQSQDLSLQRPCTTPWGNTARAVVRAPRQGEDAALQKLELELDEEAPSRL